jgi:putative PIN family toxin of toxin-antitoxin system
MRKVVLDTNILASGAISATGTLSRIMDAWRNGTFSVIISAPILDELERTFQKPYFRRYLTDKQSSRFIKLLQRRTTVSKITVSVHGIATHPEDDLILATAVSAKADSLVIGDSKLQHLGTYQGVAILSPRRFVETLEQEISEDRVYCALVTLYITSDCI